MVQDHSSSSETPKDEPDAIDLQADPVDDAPKPDAEPAKEPAFVEPKPATGNPARAPSQSGMIAAGILGGLIALGAAGAMQYAGFLPNVAPEQKAAATDDAALSALRAEVDGLKQQLATIPADLSPNDALEKRISALETAGPAPAADPKIEEQLKALEATVQALQARDNTGDTGNAAALADLSSRLAETEKKLADQPGEAAVSKAIAATYLKAAVDRGDPFLTELETFAALSPEDPALADLRGLAATGVPTKADLTKRFEPVANAMIDAMNQPVEGEGMMDRLFASARSLVSVRPVGNVEGTDAGAIVARMEDKLKNGDARGAALEWEALPAPAKNAAADFKSLLDKRVKADELTRGLAERSATAKVNAG